MVATVNLPWIDRALVLHRKLTDRKVLSMAAPLLPLNQMP